jgi:DNA-binding CsgD family transcriptional regulator
MGAEYKLPLPVLRGHLGPASLTEFESSPAKGGVQRSWRCGCTAHYRDSAHQTAVWQPCALHLAQRDEHAGATLANARDLNGDGSQRRSPSSFCIIDSNLNVLSKSSGSDVEHLIGLVRHVVERVVADGVAAVVPLDSNTVLRMTPLHGDPANAFSVQVEGRRGGSRLMDAASRYRLTPRESEVLRLALAYRTNKEISAELCIAESTVSEHFSSLFRKTDSKRRAELLIKALLTQSRHSPD